MLNPYKNARYNLNFGSQIFAFKRVSLDKKQSIICVTNLSSKIQNITLNKTYLRWKNLIKLQSKLNKQLVLGPFETIWLSNK